MIKNMLPQELHQHLNQNPSPPLLLDVREPWEFERVHIPGSQLIPMQQIPARLNELNPQQEIVVICHHGTRSMYVANFLVSNGFNNVINLSRGVDGWAKEVDRDLPTY